MDGDDDTSSLAWLWTIEALSTVKEIPIATLQGVKLLSSIGNFLESIFFLGLIDAAPVRNDKFRENAKELVALRCLEELSTRVVDPGTSSTLDSRVGFDFSRRCEDVLLEILGEIPSSNPKMAGEELLKSDVYQFIKHKRAGTFKCHLEQMREMILKGTHPHSDYLRERSGLFPGNSSYTVLVNDIKCDNNSDKDVGNVTDAENMVDKENSVSLILEHANKTSKEHLLDYNFSPSKSFEPKKVESVSQLRQEVSEHLTERILLVSEQGEHHIENQKMENLGDGSSEDSHNRCTTSKLSQSSSHIEVFQDESNIHFNDTLVPQHTFGGENSPLLQIESIPHVALPDGIQHKISGSKPWSKHETDIQLEDPNGSQQQIASFKSPDDTGNGCGVEISGDFVYQSQKINLETKKQTEQNLCLKCNEGEQLLICDVNFVQPVVPECCLGMTSTIIPQHTSVAEPCNDTSMDETKDNSQHCIPTNDANAEKVRHTINLLQLKQKDPDITSLNLSPKPAASNMTIVDMVNGCGAELSSNSDGNHNEKNYIEALKHEFLHSHCTVNQDFSAMIESTKQNCCMKCNEGGQLLACQMTTCPIIMHKNCLGASAQLDAKGNFVCPFCAYFHAHLEYCEAKKKVSLARKNLAIFVTKGKLNQAVELVHEFHRQEHCISGKSSKCEHIHVKNNKDDQLTGCEDNREDHIGEHSNDANNLQIKRSQQQAPISCIHSSWREKENVNNGPVEVLREEEIGEMPNAKRLTGGDEENEVPTDHVDGHGDKFTSEKTNIAPVKRSNVEEDDPQKMTKQHNIDGTIEPVCSHNSGKEEISENEREKHSIPRYSMRFRKRETPCKFQTSPVFLGNQLRRKKVPWTAEEEELIREGVQKFGFDDPMKWKKILKFGSHVFEKIGRRRTPQDLKDKWKNMCKTHSRSK
ncbi:hypothetical protein VNO78_21310 [Psophocarpus tetragonolobus]|uniref:Myb-like domain-containing protein n=1 Tax=Psophocarpus tetragonolobus TaxID=3891 RepID=A0AAN9XHY0_PSOTE